MHGARIEEHRVVGLDEIVHRVTTAEPAGLVHHAEGPAISAPMEGCSRRCRKTSALQAEAEPEADLPEVGVDPVRLFIGRL
jgi:hypothetical protein